MVSRDYHHDSGRYRASADKPCIPPGHLALRRSPHRGVKTETLSLNQRVTREGENRTIYPARDPDITGHRAHSGGFSRTSRSRRRRIGGAGRNGLALSRFSVIYATPPYVITPRSPVQGSRAVQEHLCLTRPYVSKARTLGAGRRSPSEIPAPCGSRAQLPNGKAQPR